MLCLFIQAPFATFRTFTAGWYRPTAGFLTHSAAYGLLLNLAGIESRLREEEADHDGKTPASLTRADLPKGALAIGVPAGCELPRVQTVFQQLHNYPVGASGAERAESTKGNKYNITPVRREVLSDLRAIVCLKDNPDFEDRIRRGLLGEFNDGRYGLPFLGDNNFLLDRVDVLESPPATRWFEHLIEADAAGPRNHTTRLTTRIDRANLANTQSSLFAPTADEMHVPVDSAWVQMGAV